MFENAVSLDPEFALAYAAIANACAQYHYTTSASRNGSTARATAGERASASSRTLPKS